MSSKRYLSAKEAADKLNISLSTLYAYVSRGLIRSEQSSEGKRQRRYYAEDIEKLLARKEGRRNPESLAKDALHWGAPVLDSAITLIDNDGLYYRGRDIATLANEHSAEEVAALIWTDDISKADALFDLDVHVSAQRYETMLLHMGMDGAELSPLQEFLTFLPSAAMDDPSAYDLRANAVASTGARILRLMASVAAGDVPENISLAEMLQHGWSPEDEKASRALNTALIATADHELNASSFAARVVASAGATPYAAVMAGLTALQGVKHGGHTERVAALFDAIGSRDNIQRELQARLRRGESIPGFGHKLYTGADPRATIVFDALQADYGDTPEFAFVDALITHTHDLIGDFPTIDVMLVATSRVLQLPRGCALTLFALGRTIGWIGQAIEQYATDRLIRPRARYTGSHPST
ncbi:MAG: citrate synthase family protein [Chloroflexota bacterium]